MGRNFNDIEKAKKENKTTIFFGFQNCSPIEDDIKLTNEEFALNIHEIEILKKISEWPKCV